MNIDSSINSVRKKFKEMVKTLGAESKNYPFNTTPHHDGSAHVEIEGNYYCYIVTERGHEIKRDKTTL